MPNDRVKDAVYHTSVLRLSRSNSKGPTIFVKGQGEVEAREAVEQRAPVLAGGRRRGARRGGGAPADHGTGAKRLVVNISGDFRCSRLSTFRWSVASCSRLFSSAARRRAALGAVGTTKGGGWPRVRLRARPTR